jgi:hypothetical protein
MTGSFIIFLFTAVLWLPGGSVQPPIVRLELTRETCEADKAELTSKVDAINNGNSPGMRISFHADCRPVLNDSERSGA